jgi:hypothetical protein
MSLTDTIANRVSDFKAITFVHVSLTHYSESKL